jgi:hypothetical protein
MSRVLEWMVNNQSIKMKLDDGGAVVGNGDFSIARVDEFVHPTRAESCADNVDDSRACVDVGNDLRHALGFVCAFLFFVGGRGGGRGKKAVMSETLRSTIGMLYRPLP